MTRLLGVVVHNWPLKMAAIGLATLLYGGLVLSQSTQELPVVLPVTVDGQRDDTFLLTAPEPVTLVRYFAPSGVRPITSTFTATIDISDVEPGKGPVQVPIVVTSLDDRITVLGSEPDVMTVELEALTTVQVPVVVDRGTVPPGLELGEAVVEPAEVEVSGPSSVVERVVAAQAIVAIQPGGIDVDQDVSLVAIDQLGDAVSPVKVEPSTARVRIPVFSDRQSRTLPVSPAVTGTPAPGFELAAITVDPIVITVEGDADELVALDRIETDPVQISGLSSDRSVEVGLALPAGVVALDRDTVSVTITLRPVTSTRNFEVGLRLVDQASDLVYALAVDRVLITVGGSVADLDRLVGATLVADLEVGGLEVGSHRVRVTADLPAGVTFVGSSPPTVTVVIGAPAPSPTPTPTASAPEPTPSPTPGG